MSTDASYQLVTQKFSFIEQINYSRSVNKTNARQKFNYQSSETINPKKSQPDNLASTSDSFSLPALTLYSNFIGSNFPNLAYNFDLAQDIEFSTAINNPPQKGKIPCDKILFALSCLYVIGVSGWIFYQTQGQFTWLFAPWQLTHQVSAEELQFLDYLERSLEVIERKTQANQTTEADSEANNPSNHPTLVYVPVYTPSPYPTVSSQPAWLPPVAQIEPPPPPQPLPPPPPPTVASSVATPSPIATATTNTLYNYVLIGILELGEQSVALFKVDGTTKKIGIGETIEDTGWILKSISNQQATISFQGKNRSLSIGEKF
ncbi:hypothetical protein Sta7437_0762 [Stanieria cyanosphaera PCC 7437]|uniref:Type II secretion system protein GspC N-terminal domain-containing protein n=1 Tax=Stanieria cyanosphaera (strain ATCC 29371 / PCC 7437) TaxID=111780 RepID=K9XP97_STAC7|nr:hypothetical protein [Stanieria cyanosphaera]AFZ34353.1 hypothetical protein Sta7437_0762 [Stanieria cyanosphaera PCC 7437]